MVRSDTATEPYLDPLVHELLRAEAQLHLHAHEDAVERDEAEEHDDAHGRADADVVKEERGVQDDLQRACGRAQTHSITPQQSSALCVFGGAAAPLSSSGDIGMNHMSRSESCRGRVSNQTRLRCGAAAAPLPYARGLQPASSDIEQAYIFSTSQF